MANEMSNANPQGIHGSSILNPPQTLGALRIGEVLPLGSIRAYGVLMRNPYIDYGGYTISYKFAEDTIYNQPLTEKQKAQFATDIEKIKEALKALGINSQSPQP